MKHPWKAVTWFYMCLVALVIDFLELIAKTAGVVLILRVLHRVFGVDIIP